VDKNILDEISNIKTKVNLDYLKQDVFELVDESSNGIQRVRQIVQDLKDFSHVGTSEWQWVDLHRGLDSTLNIVNNEIKYKAVVKKEYGDLPHIECLGPQINQVFMNLLVNAAQAIESQGEITICTGTKDDFIWVEFADTGCGIDPENLKRIFDPFYSSKPLGQGTGLGLSLSYGIVNKHGGRIEVESEVGKGTKFKVWLPMQRKEILKEVAC
jgi:signal transduction histidine kinase